MQVTETLKEGLKREYRIKIEGSELEQKVEDRLRELQPDIQMKGFRKGKVPLPLLKRQFGQRLLGETMQQMVDEAMERHFEETGDRPARQPEVKIVNEDWKEGDDLEISLSYEVLPEIPDVDFGDITLERLTVTPTEEEVQEALDTLARQAGGFEDKDGPAEEGDQVVIDFVGRIDGEPFEGGEAQDYPLVLGSGSFIPGFEEQLVGATAGETREVKVSFPEDYGAEHLAGKEAVFETTVKAVKKPVPAEIDDELAKRFGMESLEQLRERIREQLAGEYAQTARQILKRKLLDILDEKVSFELPPSLVEEEARQIAHQLWHEEHPEVQGHDHGEIEVTDEHRRLAERRVKLGLLLAELGRKNEITVSEGELTQALMAEARKYPGQEAQFFQWVQQNPGVQAQIRAPIFEDKVVDFILELAKVEDREVSRDELKAAVEALEEEDA